MSEQPEQVTTVYVVNGTRTSQGPGPGALELPVSEANALLSAKLAVAGAQPPRGTGGDPESAVRPFTGLNSPHPPRAGTRSASN